MGRVTNYCEVPGGIAESSGSERGRAGLACPSSSQTLSNYPAASQGKDCFLLLGRTLEWKHMGEASELKDRMARMVTEFGCSPHFLQELAGFYRETPETELAGSGKRRARRFDRPATGRPIRHSRRSPLSREQKLPMRWSLRPLPGATRGLGSKITLS